ncbi:DinB family protein [Microlunatus endophyticus]|uniref:DinB family protein n=1 Tax=Microlunatus endophyticus TaxID=1716077 RepID=UPI001E538BF2|nr:DinB family protein [Microlunatus endophyticus]
MELHTVGQIGGTDKITQHEFVPPVVEEPSHNSAAEVAADTSDQNAHAITVRNSLRSTDEPRHCAKTDDWATTAGERDALETFLDQYRAIVVWKLAGLSDDQAGRKLVESGTTLGGIVKHLRHVEEAWFVNALDGVPRPEWRDTDPEWQYRMEPGEMLAGLIADYESACATSRRIAAGRGLDDLAQHPRLGELSLRWVYLHMIEETARHAGHLDILREQIDGRTGFA